MSKLFCEVCNGSLVKSGGVFVCQDCGCNYTLEEVRKLLNNNDTNKEVSVITSSVKTIQYSNNNLVENYVNIAINSYDSKNYRETLEYCNKAIELDINNYKAWMLKGCASIWTSTLANIKYTEVIHCFSQGLSNCPDDKKDELRAECGIQIEDLCTSYMNTQCNDFKNNPSESNCNDILNSFGTITNIIKEYTDKIEKYNFQDAIEKISTSINNACIGAYRKIKEDYLGDENRPGDFEFKSYIDQIDYCIKLFKAASMITKDDKLLIIIYENICAYNKYLFDACSYDYHLVGSYNIKSYYVNKTLSNESKRIREADNTKYQGEIDKLKQKLATAYWNNHPQEKKQLEDRLNNLNAKKVKLETDLSNVYGLNEIKEYDTQITNLNNNIKNLSMLQIKKKRELLDKLSLITNKKNSIKRMYDSTCDDIKKSINDIQNKINLIYHDFKYKYEDDDADVEDKN